MKGLFHIECHLCVSAEPGRGNWSQALKELEPYKNYECIGHIRQYNKTIKETPPLNFTVKCGMLKLICRTAFWEHFVYSS